MPIASHARSVWLTTVRRAPELPGLAGDLQTEVAIIGGGYTGLSAAFHLAQAGIGCVVLEAHDAGWGASGRNGGMAVLRYKTPWSALARRHGEVVARRLHRLLLEAVDGLEATVQDLGIECGFSRYGHITAATSRSATAMLEADVKWLATAGDRSPRMMSAAETAALSGTACYSGGYLDARAAGIHPLEYAWGLATGLVRRGVPVFAGTAATGMHEDSRGITVETAGGRVRARQLIIATNAYTELYGLAAGLARRVVPVSTSVVSTAPLPESARQHILPQGHLVSDTRHLLNYFRLVPGNRLLFGGRGSLTGRESLRVYAGLEHRLADTFPMLADISIDHRWSGKVAVTLDDFPHIGKLSPRIAFAMGYGGRGVALSNLLGKMLADMARGETVDAGPMSSNVFAPIPFHSLRIPAMKVVAGYYRMLDALGI